MKILIQDAADHASCLGEIRSRYGESCTVVHSYKTRDFYRIIIALETNETPSEPTNIKSTTLDSRPAGVTNTTTDSTPLEVSSKLIELAARIKALEEASLFESSIGPESPEISQPLFSDVLANKTNPRYGELFTTKSRPLEKLEPDDKLRDHKTDREGLNSRGVEGATTVNNSYEAKKFFEHHAKASFNALKFAEIMDKTVLSSEKSGLA